MFCQIFQKNFNFEKGSDRFMKKQKIAKNLLQIII